MENKIRFTSVVDIRNYREQFVAQRDSAKENLKAEEAKKEKNRDQKAIDAYKAFIHSCELTIMKMDMMLHSALNHSFMESAQEMVIDPNLFMMNGRNVFEEMQSGKLLSLTTGKEVDPATFSVSSAASKKEPQLPFPEQEAPKQTPEQMAAQIEAEVAAEQAAEQQDVEDAEVELLETRDELLDPTRKRTEAELRTILKKVYFDAKERPVDTLPIILAIFKAQPEYKDKSLGTILFHDIIAKTDAATVAPIKSWVGTNIYKHTIATHQPVLAFLNIKRTFKDATDEECTAILHEALYYNWNKVIRTDDQQMYYRELRSRIDGMFEKTEDEVTTNGEIAALAGAIYGEENRMMKLKDIYKFVDLRETKPEDNENPDAHDPNRAVVEYSNEDTTRPNEGDSRIKAPKDGDKRGKKNKDVRRVEELQAKAEELKALSEKFPGGKKGKKGKRHH